MSRTSEFLDGYCHATFPLCVTFLVAFIGGISVFTLFMVEEIAFGTKEVFEASYYWNTGRKGAAIYHFIWGLLRYIFSRYMHKADTKFRNSTEEARAAKEAEKAAEKAADTASETASEAVQEGGSKYVKASFWERIRTKTAKVGDINPNPLDEFSNPKIGPNESAEPIEVQKLSSGGYEIVNGHHRWLAAIKTGLKDVPIKIVNYEN